VAGDFLDTEMPQEPRCPLRVIVQAKVDGFLEILAAGFKEKCSVRWPELQQIQLLWPAAERADYVVHCLASVCSVRHRRWGSSLPLPLDVASGVFCWVAGAVNSDVGDLGMVFAVRFSEQRQGIAETE
jgi:hypothetical protein